ncbi:MAG: sigma 54-interacting transcriptional regulator [Planctomycetota bacterium]
MHNHGNQGPHVGMGSGSTGSGSLETVDGVVGKSAETRHLCRLINKAAECDRPVLITGEIGTGKSLVAESVHRLSPLAAAPLETVDCAQFNEQQLDLRLFGDPMGSSFQPQDNPVGRLESADGGTLFLDNIDAMPVRTQARIASAIRQGGFENHDRTFLPVNLRFVAATSKDLKEEISGGRFREDLYWLLNVVPLVVSPLRRRQADIELLVLHFLEQAAIETVQRVDRVDPEAMKVLSQYLWPGNISELKTYIERAVVLAENDELTLDLLPVVVTGDAVAAENAVFRPTDEASLIHEFVQSRLSKAPEDATDLHKQIVEPVERELLIQVLDSVNQTQTKAATRLGINRNTLYKKLKEYGLEKGAARNAGGKKEKPVTKPR